MRARWLLGQEASRQHARPTSNPGAPSFGLATLTSTRQGNKNEHLNDGHSLDLGGELRTYCDLTCAKNADCTLASAVRDYGTVDKHVAPCLDTESWYEARAGVLHDVSTLSVPAWRDTLNRKTGMKTQLKFESMGKSQIYSEISDRDVVKVRTGKLGVCL